MKLTRAVLLLGAILFLCNLWGYDLWAPDEPYFGEGAREMIVDGRWAVPHVNGVVTTDKPPLFFWLIALFSLPFGEVTPLSARLTSVLAALATAALTIRLGRRWSDPWTGVLAGLMLVTASMFWEKARWAQIDSLLCLLILVSLSAFEGFRAGDADGRRAGILFWCAAALAVLAKGPVGLILPLAVALITLGVDRRLGDWRRFAPLTGPLAFAAIVGLWIVVATVGGRGEYSVMGALREHFVDRGLHGMHHVQPWWYYLKVLPAHLLPWTGLLPGAIYMAWRRRDSSDRFLLVWSVFIVVLFSISTEKRGLYVLPAFPAFALLFARLVDFVCRPEPGATAGALDRRWVTVPLGITGGLFAVLGIGLTVAVSKVEEFPAWLVIAVGAVFFLTGATTLWNAVRGRGIRSVLHLAGGISAGYLLAASFAFPAMNGEKSARPFSLRLKEITAPSRQAGEDVVAFDLSNLPEAFAFYTAGVYTREIFDPAVLADHLDRDTTVYAVVNADKLDLLPEDVRQRIRYHDRTRLSRKNVVIISNEGPGPDPVHSIP